MNNVRRQQLKKWLEDMENIKSELEMICSDEEDYLNNMPESFQCGQRGMDAEEAIDQMSEAVSAIDEAVSAIESII